MVPWISVSLLGCFLTITSAWDNVYDGYKFVEITPRHKRDLDLLSDFYKQNVDFIRKSREIGKRAVIFANPEENGWITRKLRQTGANFTIREVDFSSNREKRSIATAPLQSGEKMKSQNYTLDDYHDYTEQMSFIGDLARKHGNFVKLGTMGRSYTGKAIKYLTIGYPNGKTKPVLFIDAGIHAREWIAPAVALWMANELSNSSRYTSLLQKVDIIIVPNMNPDGYTLTRKGYRMWRKNITPQQGRCYGVDLNRNFPFYFGYSGADSDPCSEIFKGPKAASEPETVTLKNFLDQNRNRIKAYLTLHSYGENWVYPWGYAAKTYPPDVQDLIDLGNAAKRAIAKVRGTQYSVENSADGMYPASGASDDYAKSIGIKYVYTVELAPAADDLKYDFALPADQIVPTATEVFQGVLVVAQQLANQFSN